VALGFVEFTFLLMNPDPDIFEILGFVVGSTLLVLVAYCVALVFAARRRNWARQLLLLFVVLTVAVVVLLPPETPEPWWVLASTALSTILEVVAMFWLFSGSGAQWYRLRRVE
jgi:RsiW-degrading membrane proteinase PrsW (M82 family)